MDGLPLTGLPATRPVVTQIFVTGNKQIEEYAVFTASEKMVRDFKKSGDYFSLIYDFPLKRGVSIMPRAPIPS
jgi:hypothetical protein